MSDPYDQTRRLPAEGAGQPAADRTERLPDGTQRLPAQGGPGRAQPGPITYTEEYGSDTPGYGAGSDGYQGDGYQAGVERTLVEPGYAGSAAPTGGPAGPDPQESGRRFGTGVLVLWSTIALLVGFILALLLLPEEQQTVALDDAASQQALADAATQNAELQSQLDAQQAELDARQAEIDRLNAQIAGDQAAADAAQAEREAALDEREAAQDEREAALAEREAAVQQREEALAAQEGEGGGVTIPDLGDVELPDLELPQINSEDARGFVERFVDRLASLFGAGDDGS